MLKYEITKELKDELIKIFTKGKKCIINADLDGLLSGMILQHFLKWDIVGFSSCSGKEDDDLWLFNKDEDISKCVFVDLPVCLEEYATIDQHFVNYDRKTIDYYNNCKNKINPNIIRERVFKKDNGYSEYTMKYPFGTVHFLIAILENLNIINENYLFDFKKKIDNFELVDLILRADRVVGNTDLYYPNCKEWMSWLEMIGKKNTKEMFEKVRNDFLNRKENEKLVEIKMKNLGCKGIDGDCSNMLRNKDYDSLKNYFSYLSEVMNMKSIPIKEYTSYGKFKGQRVDVQDESVNLLNENLVKQRIFSLAFVSTKTLSIAYIDDIFK